MRRLLVILVLLAAVGLAAAGVYLYSQDQSQPHQVKDAPPLDVRLPELENLRLPPGDHDLIVRVTNTAAFPRRIVGMNEGCGNNSCFRSKHGHIVTVGAGETFEYHVVLMLHNPGEFASTILLNLEDHGIREVYLEVSGTCVGAGHAH